MKKKTRNSIILAVLIMIIIPLYARIFLQRPFRKSRIYRSPAPAAKVEEKQEGQEAKELKPPPARKEPQEWGRSPFVLPNEPMLGLPEEEELVLTGITWKDGRALALIGDRLVREGDIIGGKRVAKIKRDSVVFGEGKKEYILMLEKAEEP